MNKMPKKIRQPSILFLQINTLILFTSSFKDKKIAKHKLEENPAKSFLEDDQFGEEFKVPI